MSVWWHPLMSTLTLRMSLTTNTITCMQRWCTFKGKLIIWKANWLSKQLFKKNKRYNSFKKWLLWKRTIFLMILVHCVKWRIGTKIFKVHLKNIRVLQIGTNLDKQKDITRKLLWYSSINVWKRIACAEESVQMEKNVVNRFVNFNIL